MPRKVQEWKRICDALGMTPDKHYTEPGLLPDALEDPKGTDTVAAKGIIAVIVVIAAVLALAIAVVYLMG